MSTRGASLYENYYITAPGKVRDVLLHTRCIMKFTLLRGRYFVGHFSCSSMVVLNCTSLVIAAASLPT
jgi:hypothetical protein